MPLHVGMRYQFPQYLLELVRLKLHPRAIVWDSDVMLHRNKSRLRIRNVAKPPAPDSSLHCLHNYDRGVEGEVESNAVIAQDHTPRQKGPSNAGGACKDSFGGASTSHSGPAITNRLEVRRFDYKPADLSVLVYMGAKYSHRVWESFPH